MAHTVSSVAESAASRGEVRWQPIADLRFDEPEELADPELRALETVWKEARAELDGDALKHFNERLSRQIAIETGIIERIYTLDRGTTQLLIEKGIDAALIPREATDRDPNIVAAVIADQNDAVEGLFAFVKNERQLSVSYVKELHASLLRHQRTTTAIDSLGREVEVELERGAWKTRPNNPIRPDGTKHEYAPPEQVASEMDELIALHRAHDDAGVAPEVGSAWLHHRFTQIHPFQDGNGRVARCLASLVLIRAGWFPLSVTRDDRERYIAALEAADAGALAALVSLFSQREKSAFLGALSAAEEAKRTAHVESVIAATKHDLVRRRESVRREWDRAKDTARGLEILTKSRLEEVASQLRGELRSLVPGLRVQIDDEPPGGGRSHFFRRQIVETAKHLDYFADVRDYAAWSRLMIFTADSRAEIVFSTHGIGRGFRGVLGFSAFFRRRDEAEEAEQGAVEAIPLTDEVFQVNYVEEAADVKPRFERRLDEVLIRGLETWRRGL